MAQRQRGGTLSRPSDRLAPARFNYDRLSHPPATFRQEVDKVERRLPAAQKFIVEQQAQRAAGARRRRHRHHRAGRAVQCAERPAGAGGPERRDGNVALPTLVLNVVHPLVPEEIARFCAGKRAVLVVEEGTPDFLEQAIGQILRKADLNTKLHGKDVLPMAGEYTPLVVGKGLAAFLRQLRPRQRRPLERMARRRSTRSAAEVDKALAPSAAAAADLLHRLSRAARVLGHEAAAPRDRAGARRGRHRLPLVRDLRALPPGQLDPGLRHVARLRRGRVGHADDGAPSASWATAASGTTA